VDEDPDPDANVYVDAIADPHADAHAHPNADAHADPNAVGHADPNGDADTDLDADGNADTHRDADVYVDVDANLDAHSDPDAYGNLDAYDNQHANGHADPDAERNAAADGHANVYAVTVPDRGSVSNRPDGLRCRRRPSGSEAGSGYAPVSAGANVCDATDADRGDESQRLASFPQLLLRQQHQLHREWLRHRAHRQPAGVVARQLRHQRQRRPDRAALFR